MNAKVKVADVGIYGLLAGYRDLRVDADGGIGRAFCDRDDADLAAVEKRAGNVVEGACSALRAVGELLLAHDAQIASVNSLGVGDAVRMLADLLDGARLLEADAAHELKLRRGERPRVPAPREWRSGEEAKAKAQRDIDEAAEAERP